MHVKKPDGNDSVQNPFEDNRFIDHVNDHFMNSAAANYFEHQNEHFTDDEPELPNKIDFAEKEDYSEYLFIFYFLYVVLDLSNTVDIWIQQNSLESRYFIVLVREISVTIKIHRKKNKTQHSRTDVIIIGHIVFLSH